MKGIGTKVLLWNSSSERIAKMIGAMQMLRIVKVFLFFNANISEVSIRGGGGGGW